MIRFENTIQEQILMNDSLFLTCLNQFMHFGILDFF